MNRSPAFIAFLQVIGVAIYVSMFALAVNYLSVTFGDKPFDNNVLSMSFFLLAFVTSALICGSLVIGYPLYLFLSNEKPKAVAIVLWSALWFVAILLLAVIVFILA